MNLEEKTLTENYVFDGPLIKVRKDSALIPNGNVATRVVVEHPGGVCVVPLTDEDEVLFVQQFRYPYKEFLLEIPAGKRDPGEDPLTTGKRELSEETGFTAQNYVFLGTLYPTPGYCDEVIYMYLATDLTAGQTHPDEDEFVEVVKMPLSEAVQKILAGEITDAKTQTAILKVWAMRQQ